MDLDLGHWYVGVPSAPTYRCPHLTEYPMPFPRKFKSLLETRPGDVTTPNHAWLRFVVCGTTKASCGWSGWALEALFSTERSEAPAGILQTVDNLMCPRCRSQMFATGVSYRFDLSDNQSDPAGVIGSDYDVLPIDYED